MKKNARAKINRMKSKKESTEKGREWKRKMEYDREYWVQIKWNGLDRDGMRWHRDKIVESKCYGQTEYAPTVNIRDDGMAKEIFAERSGPIFINYEYACMCVCVYIYIGVAYSLVIWWAVVLSLNPRLFRHAKIHWQFALGKFTLATSIESTHFFVGIFSFYFILSLFIATHLPFLSIDNGRA